MPDLESIARLADLATGKITGDQYRAEILARLRYSAPDGPRTYRGLKVSAHAGFRGSGPPYSKTAIKPVRPGHRPEGSVTCGNDALASLLEKYCKAKASCGAPIRPAASTHRRALEPATLIHLAQPRQRGQRPSNPPVIPRKSAAAIRPRSPRRRRSSAGPLGCWRGPVVGLWRVPRRHGSRSGCDGCWRVRQRAVGGLRGGGAGHPGLPGRGRRGGGAGLPRRDADWLVGG